jgi:uncharacterized protein
LCSPHKGISGRWALAAIAAASLVALALAGLGCVQRLVRPDVVIGTANPAGIEYTLGGSICRLFNLDTTRHGLRCVDEPSAGSVENIESLRSGAIDVGIVQSDVLADAVAGRGLFASHGPDRNLRTLFAGHDEIFTVVARRELGIHGITELRGKRVNIGNPGSRQRANMERVTAALGLTPNDFAATRELTPAEQNRAFCASELDAIVYAVAHPNGLIEDVARTCRGVLVDVSGPPIDKMLSERTEYEMVVIPGGTYSGNPAEIHTFGVRSEIVTTTNLSDTTAYEVTRAVFDNFDAFRRLHPAFSMLSVSEMIPVAGRAPIHPGAVRYYRERGWMP